MYKNNRKVAILMATYNGEKYLHEQIHSINNQSFKDYTLYIRDDGSTDNTISIISQYSNLNTNIIIVEDENKNIGAKKSFIWLLENIDSDYYMFCDQDDIWLSHKIEATLSKMLEIEKEKNSLPVLIHTDLAIADQNGFVIKGSRYKYDKLYPDWMDKLNWFVVSYRICGNTVMINRNAKQVSLPFDDRIYMHDWWVILMTLKHGGIIKNLGKSTILYRQHSQQVVGLKSIKNIKTGGC